MFDKTRVLCGLIAAYILIGAGVYFYVDLPVAEFFKQYEKSPFETTMTFLSRAGESHWFILVGLVLYFIYKKRDPLLSKYGMFIVGSVAISGIISGIIKGTLGRSRPINYFNENLYGFDGWHFNEYRFNSFPSGHTTTGFAVGVALALMFPRHAFYFILFGVFIGLTRIMTTVHYVSDTMAGALIGTLVAVYLYRRYVKEPYRPANDSE